ncbi:MAG: glycerate kinase type-2 family protein [Terriglobia bacterium]
MATQHPSLPETKPSYAHGRQLAQHIFMATLAMLDVRRMMLRKLLLADGVLIAGQESIALQKPPRVVAFGKAATRMAAALFEILKGEVEAGVVVSPVEAARKLKPFRYITGGHPYPARGSLEGASAALEVVSGLKADDLVIFLVSGGGSAILEKPLHPEITLADLVQLNRLLVTGGLPIEEMNVLRKHLSAVKGGRLALAAWPARQLTVYISDVPESFPSMVASGPTMPDESTREQCYELAARYDLIGKVPQRIRSLFEQHALEETPKPEDERFARSSYYCLLSNHDAVEAAKSIAIEQGFHAEIEPGAWDLDYRQAVENAVASLDRSVVENPGEPVCLVVGGEVTCKVTGHGVGGRNLNFALYAAQKIEGQARVVLSGATDGRDGNSPSTGAVADGHTISRGRSLGLEPDSYLAASDAYHFFRTLGDTIETGFTDNNVRDLRLLMSFE